MIEFEIGPWMYYASDNVKSLKKDKCGKWMYFFDNKEFVSKICKKAVEEKIVVTAKHSNDKQGVSCFYINGDDNESHKRVIEFFLENGLIRKTKTGKLANISFKFDDQTRNGEYGERFEASIKLDMFVDLATGRMKE